MDICWGEYGDWRQLGTFDGGDHLKYFRTQSTEQDCDSSQIRYMLSKSSAPEASDFLTCHMLQFTTQIYINCHMLQPSSDTCVWELCWAVGSPAIAGLHLEIWTRKYYAVYYIMKCVHVEKRIMENVLRHLYSKVGSHLLVTFNSGKQYGRCCSRAIRGIKGEFSFNQQ